MASQSPARRYATIDVFAEQPFGGNPLAVVFDAEGLDDETMAAIAREFGYSETMFVLPPDDPAHTAHVRIFTPAGEIPFAGHPNVGTAYALATIAGIPHAMTGDAGVFEEQAGLVGVRLWHDGATVVGAELDAPQPITLGPNIPADLVARCAGLAPSCIATAAHPPRIASVGLPFAVAELKSADALAQSVPVAEAFADLEDYGTGGLYLYVRDGAAKDPSADSQAIRARMFAPLHGVIEDPATGSAACALVGLIADLDPKADGRVELDIWQGVEMGRPSLIRAQADKTAGTVGRIGVGGRCITMMEGRLRV